MKILVTGVTGKVGQTVMKHLQTNKQLEVCGALRDMSMKPAGLSPLVELDSNRPETASKAFQNVDAMFLVPCATDARVEHTNRKIDLAKQHGVKFVVLFSALGIRSSAAVPHVDLLKHCASIEEHLRSSGMQYCILRSAVFPEEMFGDFFSIRENKKLISPIKPDASFDMITLKDIGRAVESVFRSPEKWYGKTLNLGSSEAWTNKALAESLSKALNTTINTEKVSCEDYEQKLKSKGHNATHCRGVCQYMKQVDSGSIRPTASDDFKTLTGQSPMTLDMYAREMAPMLRQ